MTIAVDSEKLYVCVYDVILLPITKRCIDTPYRQKWNSIKAQVTDRKARKKTQRK